MCLCLTFRALELFELFCKKLPHGILLELNVRCCASFWCNNRPTDPPGDPQTTPRSQGFSEQMLLQVVLSLQIGLKSSKPQQM